MLVQAGGKLGGEKAFELLSEFYQNVPQDIFLRSVVLKSLSTSKSSNQERADWVVREAQSSLLVVTAGKGPTQDDMLTSTKILANVLSALGGEAQLMILENLSRSAHYENPETRGILVAAAASLKNRIGRK